MLELINIKKTFGKKTLFNSFNYKFNDNGLYILKGKSGSGKTTLLNMISGLIKFDGGNIIYSDKIENVNKDIYYILQESNLFNSLTVKENIDLINKIQSNSIDEFKTVDILKKLKVNNLINQDIETLSGGEKQRISIAQALITDAKIILADEITSNLDKENKNIIIDILKDLSKEKLIIFSTHDKTIIEEFNDYVIDLDNKDLHEHTNLKLQSFTRKDKKFNLNLKDSIFIDKKIIKKQKLRLIYSAIIFTLLITLLTITLNLSTFNKTNTLINYIENEQISSVLVTNVDKNILDENNIKYQNVSSKGIKLSDVSNLKNDLYFSSIVICDQRLNDYEIEITDYSLYILKSYGLIKYDNISEMYGKNLEINNIQIKINNIIETNYVNQDEDIISDNFVSYYGLIKISSNLFNLYFESDQYLFYLNIENNYKKVINIVFNEDNFLFFKSSSLYNSLDTLENLKNTTKIISIIIILLTFILTIYTVYIMHITNRDNIRKLKIYGLDNSSIYLTLLIEYFLPLVISTIISIIIIAIFNYYFNNLFIGIDYINLLSYLNLFFSFLFIVIIILISNIFPFLKNIDNL